MVTADELTVIYRTGFLGAKVPALDRLTLEIREGDFFALLGPNGAGKSTTIYCLLGLLRPTSGSIRVFGDTLRPGAPAFRDVAFLPEEPHYHDYLTVEEAVLYYAGLYGGSPTPAAVNAVLDRLELAPARKRRIAACSKGMKQKVGIAQCLLHQPRLLVLDEPMRGLDPMTVKEFRDILLELNRAGVTVIMNSHLLSEVELMANRAAILNKGRLVVADDIRALTREEADRYAIEVDGFSAPPTFVSVDSVGHGTLRGTIPAERLHDLITAARDVGAVVRHCTLKRATLEESVLRLLKPETTAHA